MDSQDRSSTGMSGNRPAEKSPGRRLAAGLTALLVLAAAAFVLGGHPFLAVSAPIESKTLVVEGWLPDHALEEAIAEFRRGSYEHLFTTGGPHERGSLLIEYRTSAESAAATLIRMGLSSNVITAVPSQVQHRNRTFGSAVALRDYCRDHQIRLASINLLTEGAHARRSWLCFRRALGSSCQVGIIALVDRDYDPRRWWRFSEGVKTMIGEPIGFLYAWLALDYGK